MDSWIKIFAVFGIIWFSFSIVGFVWILTVFYTSVICDEYDDSAPVVDKNDQPR